MEAMKQLEKDGMELVPKTKAKEQSRFVNLLNRSTYCHYTYDFFPHQIQEFQKIDFPENPEEKAVLAIKLHQNYDISFTEYTNNLVAAQDQT